MPKKFKKKLGDFFSPCEVRLIFLNAQRYYEISKHLENVRIPEPIRYDKSSITYEFVQDIDRNLSKIWFEHELRDENICKKLGKVLGELHKHCGNLGEKIYLHGDFVPHNIVYSNTVITIFDIEPPGKNFNFMYFYYNYAYVDLASFIFYIYTLHSFKKPWLFFKNQRKSVQAFLEGYHGATGFEVEMRTLTPYLEKEMYCWIESKDCFIFKKYIYKYFLKIILLYQYYINNILYDRRGGGVLGK